VALAPGTRLGHFEITGPLGVGGMGEVYRATDTQLKRQVAIKVLPDAVANDSDRLARFQREAEVLASLNHPHIAQIHGLQKSDGKTALVMELVEGPTLADRLAETAAAKTKGLPLDEALHIARQIADALDAAHAQGIVHRDLKPANVKVRPDGMVKVLDFGLAKALAPAGAGATADVTQSPTITSPAMTHAGVILGTAAYMSPEQARGKPVDRRADIWAFGCVLYEMVTGRRPFEGDDITDTIVAVVSKEPDWSSVPPHVQRLLRACLEKDPRKRLRDVADGWRLLEDAPAATASTPVAIARPPRRGAMLLIGTVVALLVAALAGLSWTHFRERPPVAKRVRFDVTAPEGTIFAGPTAISPDGTRLLVSAAPLGGVARLYVRSLDSGDTRPLPGTEGVQLGFFWSPDGRFVAFPSTGTLKKVEIATGRVQIICSTPGTLAVRAGAWSSNGVILMGVVGVGLMRVPDGGGMPVPVTKQTGGAHTSPTFLADQTHFLYTKFAQSADELGIFIGALDVAPEQQESKPLLPSSVQSSVLYVQSPDGDGGYVVHDGAESNALIAVPFDGRTRTPRGDAVQIASDMTSGANRPFSMSSNGVLAYRTGDSNILSTLVWTDRTGKPVGQLGEPDRYGGVVVSRDGRLVVSQRINSTGPNRALYIDVARNVFSLLTQGGSGNETPQALSPDGRVAFTAALRDSGDIYIKRAGGVEEPELLVHSGTNKHPNDWSADAAYVIYDDHHPAQRQDLWVVPVKGDRTPIPFLVTPADETSAVFSPDGKWVAYSSDASGRREVYVRGFAPDQRPAAAVGQWQISPSGGDKPRWSRDGKEIFYIATDGKMTAVPVKVSTTFEPGVPVSLFETRVTGYFPYDIAPDGRFLLNTLPAEAGRTQIAVVLNWAAGIKN
jgi:hypothetical protein